MACSFCFTGKQKLKRRLTAGEIVGQFVQAMDRLGPDERITNVVFMGMGEPLDNSDPVFRSIEILHSPWGLNFREKNHGFDIWNRADDSAGDRSRRAFGRVS